MTNPYSPTLETRTQKTKEPRFNGVDNLENDLNNNLDNDLGHSSKHSPKRKSLKNCNQHRPLYKPDQNVEYDDEQKIKPHNNEDDLYDEQEAANNLIKKNFVDDCPKQFL